MANVAVYPNPVKDLLHVEIVIGNGVNNAIEGTYHGMSLQIFTMQGILVSTQNVPNLKPGFNKTIVDVRNLPNGAYMLKANFGNYQKITKIIVNR